MRISLLTHNLSNNSLGRTYLLAKVLQRAYDVEIIGPMFGTRIWNPVDTGELQYTSVPGTTYPSFLRSVCRVLRLIRGDMIYAMKPLPSSYGIALMRIHHRIPLVLDVDDWEVGFLAATTWRELAGNLLSGIREFRQPNSYYHVRIMDTLTHLADQVTVTTRFLQNRFGGVIVPNGCDMRAFDPSKYDRESLRRDWGLTRAKVIMFLGTPRPHKGLEELVEALARLDRPDLTLMVVGEDGLGYSRQLKSLGKDRIRMVGMQPFHRIPEFLSIADLVVIPQRRSPATAGQLPMKLFDAMAMAKPIIATRVSDMPEILEGCGLIVEPGNVEALSQAIRYVVDNEQEAQRLGANARRKCEREYSWDAIEKTLRRVFDQYR